MTRVFHGARCGALLALSALAPGLLAQTPATARPKDPVARDNPQSQTQQQRNALRLSMPGSVALSPDASTLAWTLRSRDGATLHLTSATHPDPAADKLITVPNGTACAYSTPVWSPDGQTLAFLSDCAPLEGKQTKGQLQIFLWSKATGQTRQLTHLTGEIQQPAWSPDGKAVSFLFVENATRSAGALDAMKPWSGVIGEDGVEIQRVYAVDSTSGQGRFLSPEGLHIYEFDWAPSSREIAFIGANPPGENNWWVAKLYTSRTGSEEAPQVVLDPSKVAGSLHGLQIAVPRFSPDGTKIAFIGGLMSDQGSTGGDLYIVSSTGGQPTDITPNLDGSACYEAWTSDHTVGFVEDRRGHTRIVDWNASTKTAVPNGTEDLGEVSVGGGAIKDAVAFTPATHTLAFTMQGFTKAPEIYTTGSKGLNQITHLNPDAKPAARTESVEWTNGPFHVQGWLTFPTNYDPAKKYPIIVSVHGGPSASITARFASQSSWADRGYFEFQPNPRGSFGQGEAFTQANRKDFGYGDLKDIEAGLDFIESKYSIDHNREGITGWSYGGFMTMFSVTQTHRFKAAVAGAGLSDWLSYYGENSIDQWMIPFFGASVYDDPAVYAKSSAITYIKNVTTPTLVIVGDRDGECPAPQSFEFWHALRDLGVKTQLVVYPDEGHGFRNPEHIRDRAERTAKWFAENMPAS
jgi:dipeptidyl aminopeptidase/acylaminoacyl peptidase